MSNGWQYEAACYGFDTEFFFDIRSEGQQRAVKRVCFSCPVKAECLTAALEAESKMPTMSRFGVYGGLLPAERKSLSEKGIIKAVRKGEIKNVKNQTTNN